MRTGKRLLSIILTACMMLLAQMPVAAIGIQVPMPLPIEVKTEAELTNALTDIGDGGVIILENNINYSQNITVNSKSVIFSLNGFTLDVTVTTGSALTVTNGGNVFLADTGMLNVTSLNGNGVEIYPTDQFVGGSATVTNATGTGDNSAGGYAGPACSLTVNGNVSASGTGSKGVTAIGGAAASSIIVHGNVTVSGEESKGALADGGSITIDGNITAEGTGSIGATSVNKDITVKGNVTATGTDSIGADLPVGSRFNTITVYGLITASTYINIYNTSLTAEDGVVGTGDAAGYLTYNVADAIYSDSAVWVLKPLTVGAGGTYATLLAALDISPDGSTIKLLEDITESVSYTNAGKTVAIDGNNKKITGETGVSTDALLLFGSGTIKLKNLTLQGGAATKQSVGLTVNDSINVQSEGTVIANGGEVEPNSNSVNTSIGLQVTSSGIVNITEANGDTAALSIGVQINSTGSANVSAATSQKGTTNSIGVFNVSGTVNVNQATGSVSGSPDIGYGVFNMGTGPVNVTTATGTSYGVYNYTGGTINATNATAVGNGDVSHGACNDGTGTVNVGTATGYKSGVFNNNTGTINVTTATGNLKGIINGSSNGKVNAGTTTGIEPIDNEGGGQVKTGADTAVLTLNKGIGASCVLDSITVAVSGETTVGSLPSVYKNNTYNNTWYTDGAKTNAFNGTTVTGAAILYSSFYKATAKLNTAAITGVTAPVRGATPVTSLAETTEYTATIAWSPTVSGTFAESTVYTATITLTPKTGYTATGVAANFFTVAGATATNNADSGVVTAVFPSTGSSGGGGGGGGFVPPATAPAATVSGSTATAAIPGTFSGGTQTIPVSGDTMTSLTDAAKKLESAGSSAAAVINAGSVSGMTAVNATLPGTQFAAFATGTNASLQITSSLASLNFSPAAVDKIATVGTGDVAMTMATVSTASLSAAQQQAVGDRPVYSFSVTVGGTAVTELGGDVTVSVPYNIGVNEDPNAIVVYYLDASGTVQAMQGKYDAATKSVVFTTTHFSDYVIGYKKVSFTDVASSAWYANAVTFLSARGITSGTSATTFGPNITLTRGQFMTMLLRAYGVPAVANPTDNFTDAGNTYYTGYIAAAKKLDITSGVGGNMFAPEQVITRQEMFTLLYNALKVIGKLPSGASGKTLSDFSDSGSVAVWAKDAMTALAKAGTVTGSNGMLNPTSTTTRAEMAQVLYNLLGK